MAVRHGWVEKFHGDQLVVALDDLDILQRMLRELNVRCDRTDRSPALGLALVSGLTDGEVAKAVHALEADRYIGAALRSYRAAREHAHRERCEVSDLALLIKGIQLRFADRYRGWEIRIGKNYQPSMVKGYPHIGGGGEGEPTPTSEAFTADAATPMLRHDPHTGDSLTEAGAVPDDNPQPGRGVRVGLLDTRMFRHESLADHYVGRAADLLPAGQKDFTEFDGHCAFVASCILRQAPDAQLYLHHVLDAQGNGSAWDAAVALAEMAPLGLDVVNLSFGEVMTDDDSAPMVLDAAVQRLGPETVVIAAAGNNGDADRFPAGLVPRGVTPKTKFIRPRCRTSSPWARSTRTASSRRSPRIRPRGSRCTLAASI